MTTIDSKQVKNVKWGQGCDSWALLRCPTLSVVQKQVPPGCSEVAHYHARAHQFFFVLSGKLALEVDGITHEVGPQQGLSVPPGVTHLLRNRGEQSVLYLLISSPNSQGDRVLVE